MNTPHPNRSPHFQRNRTVPDLIAEGRKAHREVDTTWYKVGPSEPHGVGFTNTWGNVGGAGVPPASWYLSEDGEVRLRGKITGGSPGSVAFVLPEEVRPQYAETFIVAVDGGGQANITIKTNGEVYIESISPAP